MRDSDQPGLFELPDPGPPPAREKPAPRERLPRGRNRETWALTAGARVTITDAAALRQAWEQFEEGSVTIEPGADRDAADLDAVDLGVEGTGPLAPTPQPPRDAFDALAWLIWPSVGLERAVDAGAVRILSMDSEVEPATAGRGAVGWTVTVKLTDVEELRRLAVEAHPDESAAISDSLAVAWQRAADPFAPLRAIPGISWQPGAVVVEHLPARANR